MMPRYKYRYTGRRNRAGYIIAALIVILAVALFLNYTYQNQPDFRFAVDQMLSIFKGENPKDIQHPDKPKPVVPEPVVPTPEVEPTVPVEPTLIRGAEKGMLLYVPYAVLQRELGLEDAVSEAKRLGAAGILTDIKIGGGAVVCTLPTENQAIVKATVQNPYHLQVLAERLRNENLYLAGRVSAFRDDLAPRNLRNGFVAVRSGVMFIDGTNERSLDPYKQPARDYVTEVALAAAAVGVQEIFLADLTFPYMGKLDLIQYDTGGISKADALLSYVSELKAALDAVSVKLTVELPARGFYDVGYGERSGQNLDASKLPCDVAVSLLVSTMPKTLTVSGTEYVNDLSVAAYENISKAILSQNMFAQTTLVPIIEAGLPATEETIAAQKKAAETARVVYWGALVK